MNKIAEQIKNSIFNILSEKERCVVAIDGRCGAGKSTLAALLAKELDTSVIHMDDFFLQSHQRTEERRNEPGGNVDYERFEKEIIQHIEGNQDIRYSPFDCHSQSFAKEVCIKASKVILIEGAYSCHPKWWGKIDLHVFLDIDADLQLERIAARNGADAAERFRKLWIPLEERYISTYGIEEKCDLCFKMK